MLVIYGENLPFCVPIRGRCGQNEPAGEFPPVRHVDAVELGDLGFISQPELFETTLCAGEDYQLGADGSYKRTDGRRSLPYGSAGDHVAWGSLSSLERGFRQARISLNRRNVFARASQSDHVQALPQCTRARIDDLPANTAELERASNIADLIGAGLRSHQLMQVTEQDAIRVQFQYLLCFSLHSVDGLTRHHLAATRHRTGARHCMLPVLHPGDLVLPMLLDLVTFLGVLEDVQGLTVHGDVRGLGWHTLSPPVTKIYQRNKVCQGRLHGLTSRPGIVCCAPKRWDESPTIGNPRQGEHLREARQSTSTDARAANSSGRTGTASAAQPGGSGADASRRRMPRITAGRPSGRSQVCWPRS